MMKPDYYREQAGRARRLARVVITQEISRQLHDMAQDYEEIADDLETGAVEVRRPELMSEKQRGG